MLSAPFPSFGLGSTPHSSAPYAVGTLPPPSGCHLFTAHGAGTEPHPFLGALPLGVGQYSPKVLAYKSLPLFKLKNAKRAGRLVRRLRSRAYRLIKAEAVFLARKLTKKALRYKAMVIIDDDWESLKELLTRKYGGKVGKLLLSGLKRFVKLLVTQLQWYGVPYEFRRLYSKKCPRCGHKLTQQKGRTMVCENCEFKSSRDMVPMYWVIWPRPSEGNRGLIKQVG